MFRRQARGSGHLDRPAHLAESARDAQGPRRDQLVREIDDADEHGTVPPDLDPGGAWTPSSWASVPFRWTVGSRVPISTSRAASSTGDRRPSLA